MACRQATSSYLIQSWPNFMSYFSFPFKACTLPSGPYQFRTGIPTTQADTDSSSNHQAHCSHIGRYRQGGTDHLNSGHLVTLKWKHEVMSLNITVTCVTWLLRRLESPAIPLFVQQLVQISSSEYHTAGPFVRGIQWWSGDRWILHTKDSNEECIAMSWRHALTELNGTREWHRPRLPDNDVIRQFSASNPAFGRGRQIVSFRFENHLLVPRYQN